MEDKDEKKVSTAVEGDDVDDDATATATATATGDGGSDSNSENPMATAFQHWRATTSPGTSANTSPTKSKTSETQEDQGQGPLTSSGPPSRRASIEQVVDDVLAKAIEAVVSATGTQVTK